MAVLFEGEVRVMINRHSYIGDGIVLTFPDCIIFSNTGGKFTLQLKPSGVLGTNYESVADAYIAAQVHFGKLELKGDMYVPVNA